MESNMTKIYTIQISVAEKLDLTQNPCYLDITVKKGGIFAPTWKMVMDHKRGKISDEEYTKQYHQIIRKKFSGGSVGEGKILLKEFMEPNELIILACYCRANTFCHRYLLKDILVKQGAEYGGEVKDIKTLKFKTLMEN